MIAIAHLEGITTNKLVRRLVAQEIKRMADHPRVAADIENRRGYAEEKSGEVVPLRRSGGGRSQKSTS